MDDEAKSDVNTQKFPGLSYVFIVLIMLCIVTGVTYILMSIDHNYDVRIEEKIQRLEALQIEIESMIPSKLKIEKYKEETKKIKDEIEQLKQETNKEK
ncbi:MAG TPA: hypothetical protein PL110_10395 [Candidatus Eremiobacteraeota bacterium]|nr:hypothetical protein [Candidatus Eremiobacteraeota bacterium]